MTTLLCLGWPGASRLKPKLLHRENAQHDENHHDDKLGDKERWFFLRGSQSVRCRNFHKNLRHQNEHVQVEGEGIAIASAMSETTPITWDGRICSTGKRKPVALVKTVVTRKIAVAPSK